MNSTKTSSRQGASYEAARQVLVVGIYFFLLLSAAILLLVGLVRLLDVEALSLLSFAPATLFSLAILSAAAIVALGLRRHGRRLASVALAWSALALAVPLILATHMGDALNAINSTLAHHDTAVRRLLVTQSGRHVVSLDMKGRVLVLDQQYGKKIVDELQALWPANAIVLGAGTYESGGIRHRVDVLALATKESTRVWRWTDAGLLHQETITGRDALFALGDIPHPGEFHILDPGGNDARNDANNVLCGSTPACLLSSPENQPLSFIVGLPTVIIRAADTTVFAVGTADGQVHFPGFGPNQPSKAKDGHLGPVIAMASGRALIVSLGADSAILVWDRATAEPGLLRRLTPPCSGCEALAISSSGVHVIAGGPDGAIVWRVSTGDVVSRVDHGATVQAVAVTDDGIAATAGADGRVRLWRIDTGRTLGEVRGHGDAITHMALLPGNRLVTAGLDGRVRVASIAGAMALSSIEGLSIAGFVAAVPTLPSTWLIGFSMLTAVAGLAYWRQVLARSIPREMTRPRKPIPYSEPSADLQNSTPRRPSRRLALVLGNAAYKTGPLRTTLDDAALMTSRLKSIGYEIVGGASTSTFVTGRTDGVNASWQKTIALLHSFQEKISPGSAAVIYYAGHAVRVANRNYLCPVDTTFDFKLPNLGLIEFKPVIERIAVRAGSSGSVSVFLDACRNSPISPKDFDGNLLELNSLEHGQVASQAVGSGLASIKLARNTEQASVFIGFSAAPGDISFDGALGDVNSPFADALARHLITRGLTVEEMFTRVQLDVSDGAADAGVYQNPWRESYRGRAIHANTQKVAPILAIGLGGLASGMLVSTLMFEGGSLLRPPAEWVWWLGAIFGLVAGWGTLQWGSGRLYHAILAFLGPTVGFFCALAVLMMIPAYPASLTPTRVTAERELASNVLTLALVVALVMYIAAMIVMRVRRRHHWPASPVAWVMLMSTWIFPVLLTSSLVSMAYLLSYSNPFYTTITLAVWLASIIYAVSAPISCHPQESSFRSYGPVVGAIQVSLMAPVFFAAFAYVTLRFDLTADKMQIFIVASVGLWHMLLGMQLGYSFSKFIPEHRRDD